MKIYQTTTIEYLFHTNQYCFAIKLNEKSTRCFGGDIYEDHGFYNDSNLYKWIGDFI